MPPLSFSSSKSLNPTLHCVIYTILITDVLSKPFLDLIGLGCSETLILVVLLSSRPRALYPYHDVPLHSDGHNDAVRPPSFAILKRTMKGNSQCIDGVWAPHRICPLAKNLYRTLVPFVGIRCGVWHYLCVIGKQPLLYKCTKGRWAVRLLPLRFTASLIEQQNLPAQDTLQ